MPPTRNTMTTRLIRMWCRIDRRGFMTSFLPHLRRGAILGRGRRRIAPRRRCGRNDVMNPRRSIRHHILISLVVIVFLVGGIGGWAATSEFAGAVIAQGQLVVDTNVKKVQHPTGGVVAELNVRDGDQVKLGDVVLK